MHRCMVHTACRAGLTRWHLVGVRGDEPLQLVQPGDQASERIDTRGEVVDRGVGVAPVDVDRLMGVGGDVGGIARAVATTHSIEADRTRVAVALDTTGPLTND